METHTKSTLKHFTDFKYIIMFGTVTGFKYINMFGTVTLSSSNIFLIQCAPLTYCMHS